MPNTCFPSPQEGFPPFRSYCIGWRSNAVASSSGRDGIGFAPKRERFTIYELGKTSASDVVSTQSLLFPYHGSDRPDGKETKTHRATEHKPKPRAQPPRLAHHEHASHCIAQHQNRRAQRRRRRCTQHHKPTPPLLLSVRAYGSCCPWRMRSGSSERASVAAAAKAAEGWPLPGSTPGSAALLWSPPRIRRGWHGNGDGQGGPPFEREPFARIVPAVAVAFPPPTGPAANARGLPDAREEPGPAPALSPSRPSSLPGTGSSCAADYRRRLEAVRERRALLRDSPDRRWPVVAKEATATDAKAKETKAMATNATTNAPRGRPDRDGYRPHSLPLHHHHHHPFPPRTNGAIGRNLSPGKPWHRTGAMVGDGPKQASGNLSAVVASSTGSPLCNDRSLPDGKSRNDSQDDSKDNTGIDTDMENNNNNSRQGHGILERRSDGQHPFPAEACRAATGANGHRGSTHHHRAPSARPHTKRARSSLRRVLCRPPEPAVDTGFAQIWGTQEAGGGVLRERPVSSGARPGADPWYKRPAGTGGGRDHPFERVMHVVWFVTEPEQ